MKNNNIKPNMHDLVAKYANQQNVDKDELLKVLYQELLESLMEGERTALLGYGKHDFTGYGTTNSHNGYYQRDLLTGIGNLENLKGPRDRNGDYEPIIIDKWERSTKPMDRLVLSLYAKGMSTRDINDVIKKIYGKTLSPQSVTLVTQEIEQKRDVWEQRKLKAEYTAIFINALHTKVRREIVSNDAVYVVCGIDNEGYRDMLGLYYGASESATFWKEYVLKDLKKRDVKKVLIFVMDGLTGLLDAVNEEFPKALAQLCVMHKVRATLSKARPIHKRAVADDLRTIYTSRTYEEAKQKLNAKRKCCKRPNILKGN